MQVNLFTGLAKLLMGTALLFFLIGLGAPHWTKGTGFHFGLWEVCSTGPGGDCARIDSDCKYTASGFTLQLPVSISADSHTSLHD